MALKLRCTECLRWLIGKSFSTEVDGKKKHFCNHDICYRQWIKKNKDAK